METKLITIYDTATRIRVMATMMQGTEQGEEHRLRLTGHGGPHPLLVVTKIEDMAESEWDPYNWGNRGMIFAHDYIHTHWDKLKTCDSIDIEYLMKKTTTPRSEGNEHV